MTRAPGGCRRRGVEDMDALDMDASSGDLKNRTAGTPRYILTLALVSLILIVAPTRLSLGGGRQARPIWGPGHFGHLGRCGSLDPLFCRR